MSGSALAGGAVLASCATSASIVEQAPDPTFNEPYIDVDEWRDAPVRHRYVHGGFRNTDARFVFFFPPPEQFDGRFFQYVSPVPVPEDQVFTQFGNDSPIAFCFDSGAYAVGSNQGGAAATATPGSNIDPEIGAFRVSAAAANYSRVVAAEMYGQQRIYGYVYGGSGGAFRTIGCVENTTAWDGAVPFVMGSPMAIPNVFTVRCHALRVLRDKLPQIVDAAEPGGGDIYAGLNEEERGALDELLKLGFPKRALPMLEANGLGAFAILFDIVQMVDAPYFTEFWTTPGYLGANPPASLLAARVQHRTVIERVVMSNEAAAAGLPAPMLGASDADTAWRTLQQRMGGAPFAAALEVRQSPPAAGDLRRAAIRVRSGAESGRTLALSGVHGNTVMLNVSLIGGPLGAPAAANLVRGDEIEIDNSSYLAAQTYHRHQVPGPDYPVWDQFRNPDGTPKYPQRPSLLGPSFQQNAAGTLPTARFNGKMIVVETLLDCDAYPWQADWYRKKVEAQLGARTNDRYRLWMVDNATHGGPHTARTISYDTVLQQALRDLSAWVERGIRPPANTAYQLEDGQVLVPPTAAARRGVQPVISLTANGGARAAARVGEPVTFSAVAEVPPRTGAIVEALWDFAGAGAFADVGEVTPAARVALTTTHSFTQPGTYFVGLRVASHRRGDQHTPFAKLYNLARVRVVVT